FCTNSVYIFFSSRRRHTRFSRDWSSDVCSSDLTQIINCETEVLNEKFSISSVTFLMVLCSDLYISFVGSSSVTFRPLSSKYNLQIGRASCRESVYGSVDGRGVYE